MLRFFDANNVDNTDEREYYSNPSCLGEPWCSSWGICSEENDLAAGSHMERENDPRPLDQMYREVERLLSTNPLSELSTNSTPKSKSPPSLPASNHHQAISRFGKPKTSEEVLEARQLAIPKRTRILCKSV